MRLVKCQIGIISQLRMYSFGFSSSRMWIHNGIVCCAFEDSTLIKVGSVKFFYSQVKRKSKWKAGSMKELTFTESDYNETSYYIENELRKVYPYYYTYKTFAKARWFGRNILDVFTSEFRVMPELSEVHEYRIRSGLLTVNNEKVTVDYKIRNNDLIASTVHRHELPVCNEPITIVHKDNDMLVVNKPPSIPVHPCGRYRHNTLVFILAKEYNLRNVHPIHRLDRLTSGITILRCRPTVDDAVSLEEQLHSNKVNKEYICRVEGDFPAGVVVCQKPIKVISRVVGVSKVSPDGKMCTTVFEKLSSNGKTSLLSCKPLTGRTHQIRVHLQYLGYPIVKDYLYNNTVFGPNKGKDGITGKTDEQLLSHIIEFHRKENLYDVGNSFKNVSCLTGSSHAALVARPKEVRTSSDNILSDTSGPESKLAYHASNDKLFNNQYQYKPDIGIDKHCRECNVVYRDPKPSDLFMCLHAWKYESSCWSYQTELPVWAEEEWNE